MRSVLPEMVLIACVAAGCSGGQNQPQREEDVTMKKVMVSPLAGRWYQDSERALRDEIADLCKDVTSVRKKNVCAAVVPHAGYRYSGRVAAGVFLRIDPKSIGRVVVMGPSHYVGMHNRVSIPDATHFRTPLGELPVDTAFVKRARALPFVTQEPQAHTQEHSDQIVAWYRAFEDVEDRAKVATLDEIKKEGWTLNISRYVLPPIGQDIPPLPEAVEAFKTALADARAAEDHLRKVLVEGGWLQ